LTRARGLLAESGDGAVVRFCHPLIRDVVYDATPADVRRELHESAARALEPTTTDSLILGHHQEMAGNLLLASTLLTRAGDDAVHQLDDTGAIALYQRALAAARQLMLADDDSSSRIRFVTLSVKLADALRVSGQVSLARGLVEEAKWHSRGTPRLEAQLLQASAHLYACEHKHELAIDCLHRGIGLAIHAGDMELLAELYFDLSSMYMGKSEPEKSITELREGLDLVTMGEGAEAQEGPKILWRLLLRMAQLHSSADRMAQAVQLAERALVHARRIRSRIGSARVQTLLASFYEQMGDLRLADKYRQAAVGEMRRLGDRRGTAELLLSGVIPTRTLLRINPANLREARELADEVGWVEGVAQASRKTSQIKDL
jgi:eukaryotic-like serine/threonine-protein kinase